MICGNSIDCLHMSRTLDDCGEVLSPQELSAVLNLGRDSTYALLNDGTIGSVRVGRRWLVPRMAVERFLLEGCKDRSGGRANDARARTSEEQSYE